MDRFNQPAEAAEGALRMAEWENVHSCSRKTIVLHFHSRTVYMVGVYTKVLNRILMIPRDLAISNMNLDKMHLSFKWEFYQ